MFDLDRILECTVGIGYSYYWTIKYSVKDIPYLKLPNESILNNVI